MPATVTLAESAVRDLEDIVAFDERQAVPQVGARLVGTILERIESLGDFPDAGRVVPEFDTPALRELIEPPFRIVYRRERDRVRIVRVWRSERLLTLPSRE